MLLVAGLGGVTIGDARLQVAGLAWAQERVESDAPEPAQVVVIVSMDRVLSEAEASKTIQEQADRIRSSIQNELSKRQSALRAEELELTELRDNLDPESFNQRVTAFKGKVRELQRDSNASGARLQRAVRTARAELKRALQPILLEIMKERRALVMLDEKHVVISATALDATQEVIERLNAASLQIEVRMNGESDE